MFDINILPDRYRRRKLTLWTALPTVLFLLLLAAIYPAYLRSVSAQDAFKASEATLNQVQTSFEAYQSSNEDMLALEAEIAAEKELQDQIISSYGGLEVSGQKYSPTLYAIVGLTPESIRWTFISELGGVFRLEGVAADYPEIISLLESLQTITDFEKVEIISVDEWLPDEPVPVLVEDSESSEEPAEELTPFKFVIQASLMGEVLP